MALTTDKKQGGPVKVRFIKNTTCAGKPRSVGEVAEIAPGDAAILAGLGAIEPAEKTETHRDEPPANRDAVVDSPPPAKKKRGRPPKKKEAAEGEGEG